MGSSLFPPNGIPSPGKNVFPTNANSHHCPVVHHGNKETAFVILKRYDNNQKIILKTPPVFQGDDA
jgi:hypothetical protein